MSKKNNNKHENISMSNQQSKIEFIESLNRKLKRKN